MSAISSGFTIVCFKIETLVDHEYKTVMLIKIPDDNGNDITCHSWHLVRQWQTALVASKASYHQISIAFCEISESQ
jgi:hypothetical protein